MAAPVRGFALAFGLGHGRRLCRALAGAGAMGRWNRRTVGGPRRSGLAPDPPPAPLSALDRGAPGPGTRGLHLPGTRPEGPVGNGPALWLPDAGRADRCALDPPRRAPAQPDRTVRPPIHAGSRAAPDGAG